MLKPPQLGVAALRVPPPWPGRDGLVMPERPCSCPNGSRAMFARMEHLLKKRKNAETQKRRIGRGTKGKGTRQGARGWPAPCPQGAGRTKDRPSQRCGRDWGERHTLSPTLRGAQLSGSDAPSGPKRGRDRNSTLATPSANLAKPHGGVKYFFLFLHLFLYDRPLR